MKTMKAILIIITALMAVAIYGKILNTNSNNTFQIQAPEERILGIWVMENDPLTKIEFLSTGVVNIYINNTVESNYNYLISNECDGTIPSDNKLVLKYIYPEGDIFCNYILNGVYEENNNILSLLTEGQGKIIVYVRP